MAAQAASAVMPGLSPRFHLLSKFTVCKSPSHPPVAPAPGWRAPHKTGPVLWTEEKASPGKGAPRQVAPWLAALALPKSPGCPCTYALTQVAKFHSLATAEGCTRAQSWGSASSLCPHRQHPQATNCHPQCGRQDKKAWTPFKNQGKPRVARGGCEGHLPHPRSQRAGTAPLAASPPPRTPGSSAPEAAWHCVALSAAASSPALKRSGPGAGQGRAGSSGPAGHCPAHLAHSSLPAGAMGEGKGGPGWSWAGTPS